MKFSSNLLQGAVAGVQWNLAERVVDMTVGQVPVGVAVCVILSAAAEQVFFRGRFRRHSD